MEQRRKIYRLHSLFIQNINEKKDYTNQIYSKLVNMRYHDILKHPIKQTFNQSWNISQFSIDAPYIDEKQESFWLPERPKFKTKTKT